jgi:hypothetical protein
MNTDETLDLNEFCPRKQRKSQGSPPAHGYFNKFLVLLCWKLYTFVAVTLALGSVMQYVEVDEPPWVEFLASA